ncbi:MAG: phosphate signaling complex protein PhoU [Anaerolineae bacterium]
MPRQILERELKRLQDEVLILGSMVGEALLESMELLKRRDLEGSRRLVAADRIINEKRFAIEGDTLTLIATQQPMAGDLRILAAVLEIITELERIGDYAKGIARINIMMGEAPLLKPLVDLPQMAQKSRALLQRALDAFVRRDVAAARAIPKEDDEIDSLYNQVYRELLTYMMEDPHTIDRASHLLWVAHNLERSSDRVTNICERVVFMVTGEMTEMDVEEDWN